MDNHQWHFRPPTPTQSNTVCPICLNIHFPFCLPTQPSPYTHQNPSFISRPGFDQRPWKNMNPYLDIQNPVPTYDYYGGGGGNGFVSEGDRHYSKRIRVDERNYQMTSERERRLKLIRDHGCGGGSGIAANGFNSFENHAANHSVHVDDWQNYGPYNHLAPPPPLPPPQQGYENFNAQVGYLPHHTNCMGQPPLPTSPSPPIPVQPPLLHDYPPPQPPPPPPPPPLPTTSLFPVPVSIPSSFTPIPHVSAEFISEESQSLPTPYTGQTQSFPLRQLSPDKLKAINASHLFKQPHRATRPDHFVIILRGLPGSGKSYIAKMLRDLEVENGGDAPRIHSMDDYFMTEVEKVEEGDVSKSSGSRRSKKPMTKKVMEYCYEPEMEEGYRSSMLKAVKRTLEEGSFTFVIVDDRNLRVADFAQFWASAKRLGYEVYILEATYKDPAGCAARNVHGFTLHDIKKMAGQWEETPSLYLQLDIKSLFHGDDLKESGIKEVDMDMEDEDYDGLSAPQQREPNNISVSIIQEDAATDSHRDDKRWDTEGGDHPEVVKDLGRSKWSNDLDEEDADRSDAAKANVSGLPGLFQAYGKEGKSVSWSDQGCDTGFSIGATPKSSLLSLVIGPGAGYNLNSNPLPKEGSATSNHIVSKSKKHSIFQDCLRAERESFKAVFDRRRQWIGRLDLEEE